MLFNVSLFPRMRWMREIGLIDRVHRVYVPPKPRCEAGSREFVSVSMTDIRPAVIFVMCGFLTSFLIMMLEIFCEKVKAYRERIHTIPTEMIGQG